MFIKGTHRYVFIIGGLVFKVPRMAFTRTSISFAWWLATRKEQPEPYLAFLSLWRKLSDGVNENLREALFWHRTHHHLVVPVLLPLIIVNVYPEVEGVGDFRIGNEEWYRSYPIPHPPRISEVDFDGHTFDSRNNFAYSQGRVLMIDYGGMNIPQIVETCGDWLEGFLRYYAGRTS